MNAAWHQREEARRHLSAQSHGSNLRKAVKMAGKNLRKVRKTAVLSFVWDFVRKLETRTRKGDQAGFYKHFKKRIPFYVYFIDLTKAYDSVDRTLLWTVLARFGVPQIMISVIRQFHDSMRACVRLDDRVCSRWFAVEQGLRQGCVLAPLLFNIFFAAVINVASTRFRADKGIMDGLVHLRKKRGAGGRGKATVGESVLATPLWGMLYADDAGVVSQLPEQLRKMMRVIVVVCAAFGLTVSEAKTEIMCLRAKGMSTATFSVEAAGQVYNQANEFVKRQPQCRSVHRGRPAHTQRMVQLPEVHP